MKVIIAGTRTFNNYSFLKQKMDSILANVQEEIVIISGKAPGADTLGERYAKEKGFEIIEKPADWDGLGKKAGYVRNEEMAKIADACVCFHDKISPGTKNMIELAKKYRLKLRIIFFK